MKLLKRGLLPLSIFFITVVFFTASAHAVNMDSNQYHIKFGTIDIGGQKMSNPAEGTYLSTSLGQTAAGQFQSNGYIVKAGFQYIYSRIPFTFSVSNIRADLGTLTPNTPSTAAINLSVSFGGAGQYVVTAGEMGPFRNFDNIPIANTACDGGANTCSTTLAKPWTSLSAYGFGYSMSGTDIPADFINATYYRPFADKTVPQQPATVMQSSNVTQNLTPTPNPSLTPAPLLTGTPRNTTHQSTMTFKVNISPLQSAGSYNTVIHFVATPSF
jgi:hypothetical protein